MTFSVSPAPGKMLRVCEVSLDPREIRFRGCDSDEARIAAVKQRLSLIDGQLEARSGPTNKERRALNREANVLRRWLSPDDSLVKLPRSEKAKISNLRSGIRSAKRRKPTKRERRVSRRAYREQHELHVQVRPDYSPPVFSLDELKAIRRIHEARVAKEDWFRKKQQQLVPVVA